MDKTKKKDEEKFYTFYPLSYDEYNFVFVGRGYGISVSKKKKEKRKKMKKERFVYWDYDNMLIGEGTSFHHSGLKMYVFKMGKWVTVESTTGLPLCWGNTKKEAMEETKKRLDTEIGEKVEYEIKFGARYLEEQRKVRQFKLDNNIDID